MINIFSLFESLSAVFWSSSKNISLSFLGLLISGAYAFKIYSSSNSSFNHDAQYVLV